MANDLCKAATGEYGYDFGREDLCGIFYGFLTDAGFSSYGQAVTPEIFRKMEPWLTDEDGKTHGLKNSVFALRPSVDDGSGLPDGQPNFMYRDGEIKIVWNRSPFGEAYINTEVTAERFREILADCLASLKESAEKRETHQDAPLEPEATVEDIPTEEPESGSIAYCCNCCGCEFSESEAVMQGGIVMCPECGCMYEEGGFIDMIVKP